MKFIHVTPIYYNSTLNKYQESSSKILIAVDSIAMVYEPEKIQKQPYYTVWFKDMNHQNTIKTFDKVIDKLLEKR